MIPFLYAIVLNVFNKSEVDFSYVRVYVNGLAYTACCIFVAAYFIQNKVSKNELIEFIFIAFVIQAIVIVLAMFNTSVNEFVRSFQDQERAVRDYRALTLSGPLYFALAITIVFYLFFYFSFNIETKRYYKYMLIFVVMLPFLTIGRVLFILPLICFLYALFVYPKRLFRIVFYFLIWLVIAMLGVKLLIMSGVLDKKTFSVLEPLIEWMFEFVINMMRDGKFSSESTDMLETMYFPIDSYTFLFGDGKYTGIDGRYYMYTDAGYMRNILLFGFFFSLPLLVVDCIILYEIAKYYFIASRVYCFFTLSLLSLLILHYKGEVFGYAFPLHLILYLLYFFRAQPMSYTED